MTCAVLDQVPGFRDHGPPQADLDASVRQLLQAALAALREGRPDADERDQALAHAYGARRAADGIPVEEVTLSFTVAVRVLWREIQSVARQVGALDDLASVFEMGMLWLHSLSGSMHAGYRGALGDSVQTAAARRLGELLSDPAATATVLRSVLDGLGLEAEGEFQVWAADWRPDLADASEARARLAAGPGTCVLTHAAGGIAVVGQDADPAAVEAVLLAAGAASVGVGLVRRGPVGVRHGLADADSALRIAQHRPGIHRYAVLWPYALVADADPSLDPVLAEALGVARSHPHLADAIRAFADHGFSAAAAARVLRVHANTLAYRLDRWNELTGLDCRDYAGLIASRTAVELAPPAS
ncbi:helix-turn-helix domain-containing protein [Kitasatospora sp. NPDC048296]|uniref:helix-turn-helix domain-containing protein n=1 Tax=Kitasatospora sp. NPDC048296 TaxID=3364048 RepID=UPI003713DEBA